MTKRVLIRVIGLAGLIGSGRVSAQTAPAPGPAAPPLTPVQMETRDELMAKLNAEQKQKLDEASKAFGAKQYPEALVGFKELLGALPGDVMLAKFASESALNAGDSCGTEA